MKKVMIFVGALFLVAVGFYFGTQSHNLEAVSLTEAPQTEIQELVMLSDIIEGETPDPTAKMEQYFELKNALIEIHQQLRVKHQELQAARQSFQSVRSELRNASTRLTLADRQQLASHYQQALANRQLFEDSKGLAYQRLADLKGQYSLENIDLILQTMAEVLEVLEQRYELVSQTITLFEDSKAILQTYLS